MDENHRTGRLKGWARFLLAGYWLALVIATHVPDPPDLIPWDGGDKLLHVGAYAGLAFLLCLNVSLLGRLTWRTCAALLVFLAVYGALDEVTQTPFGRQRDQYDWAADVAGAVCGIALFGFIVALKRRQETPREEPAESLAQ